MSDLISRQAAIDECNKRGAEHIGYAIAHLPSEESEVIRCKDCENWDGLSGRDGYCYEMYASGFDEDFYCAYAKRRTDEVD